MMYDVNSQLFRSFLTQNGGASDRVDRNHDREENEYFCFACFGGGGDLLVCNRQYCRKAYHPHCINQEKSYSNKSGWNCEWHTCNKCEKAAYYMCFTCTYSLCEGCKECIKEAEYSRVRGRKGFCKRCMDVLAMIRKNDQGKTKMPMDESGENSSDENINSDEENENSDEDDERPTESATERKAELIITPQNIGPDDKKAEKKAKKRALNIVCKHCGRKFGRDKSLRHHTRAKHRSKAQHTSGIL